MVLINSVMTFVLNLDYSPVKLLLTNSTTIPTPQHPTGLLGVIVEIPLYSITPELLLTLLVEPLPGIAQRSEQKWQIVTGETGRSVSDFVVDVHLEGLEAVLVGVVVKDGTFRSAVETV